MTESKAERFKRLATYRTQGILERLRILGHCANRQMYEYTEDQVESIFCTIEKQMKEEKQKFYFTKKKISFKL